MEKMKLETLEMSGFYAGELGGVIPEVVTEIRDENGKLKKAVDFEKLKALLTDSKEIVEPGEEHYEFTWVGKKEAMMEAYKPIRKTLRPCIDESVDWDNTGNLYVQGENLEVLKLFQESYLNSIKLIYIDPPYNSGKDKILYPDKYRMSEEEYVNKTDCKNEEGEKMYKENNETNPRFHSTWCSMIYQRLLLARNLLTKDGIIAISIDEKEYYNLRNICNEVLGEKNYVGDIVWEATTQPINAGTAKFGLQKKTENIVMYAKDKAMISGFVLEEENSNVSYPHDGKYGKCRYEIIEKSDSGEYSRPSMKFRILGKYPREGKRWQIGEEKARELEKAGKIEIVDGVVKKAVYPEDEKDKKRYKPFWSLFSAQDVGTAQTGKDELNKLMGTNIGFDTVKPTKLIKKLLSYLGNDFIVLDFFSGSGTTAAATLMLNAECKKNIKFIAVQIDENCDEKSDAFKAGYKNIYEIGRERIHRAGDKIREENKDKDGINNIDTGFRVLKVDDSNMKDVYFNPEDYDQTRMGILESNIKEDRTELDLLFSCLIDWGLPLNKKYESNKLCDNNIHVYNKGDLIACFDKQLSEETVKEIAKMEPLRVVFRDSCFSTSADKINVEEIFKLLSPDTSVRVL